MNIKTVIVAAIAAIGALAIAADNSGNQQIKRRKPGIPSGGYLELKNKGKVLQVVNLDEACPAKVFEKAVANVGKVLHFPFSVTAINLTGKIDDVAAARVVVVNRDGQPALLCAPEDRWCEVNIKSLSADSPKEFILQRRVEKEVLRALGYALGCGNSSVTPCVMSKVDSLDDLDALQLMMGPESLGKTLHTAGVRGCEPRKYVSYRKACQEGWAPQPTNDAQRVIWNQVHQIPDRPITIEFDPKKDK